MLIRFPEGLVLGLSTGAICLAYCGPVLMPYLLGEGNTVKKNSWSVGLFLAGRLLAYLIVGWISGWAGMVLLKPSGGSMVLFGIIYLLLAVLLITYGFHRFREVCLGQASHPMKFRYLFQWPFLVPAVGGFVTGLNLCPPFLLAITEAMEGNSIQDAVLFFVFFFVGTSVYFVPLPFIGIFRRQQALRTIGKFAAILAGVFYFYKGTLFLVTAI